jgi:hypothetical protein
MGEQPWPTLILKGATTKDGKPDTKKRKAEMAQYAGLKVHVLWQKSAWLTEELCATNWIDCFEADIKRLGLEDAEKLIVSDNLAAQKSESFVSALRHLDCMSVYGPKNGTDVWQPVDHGVGQRYQDLIAGYYIEWTKSEECQKLFTTKKAISTPRVRALLVEWTHRAYEQLESDRQKKEEAGEASIFENAFLRTGLLVSANGDDIDDKIRPEGLEAAMEKSKDTYFKNHKITTFRELLKCSDKTCEHVPPPAPLPVVSQESIRANAITVRKRFAELERSTDRGVMLLVKCLRAGTRWAGSSLVTFISGGVWALRLFLAERTELGEPVHIYIGKRKTHRRLANASSRLELSG